MVAEATTVWTDDAGLMPLHDELAASLCAVTCEANKAELDAALEVLDHTDADRLACKSCACRAQEKLRATSEGDFEGQHPCDSRCGHQ